MIRQEQCDKVCRILDDVLANRPTERDSLIIAVRKAFESLKQFGNSEQLPSAQPEQRWVPVSERLPEKEGWYITTVESEKTGKRRIENDLFAVDIALAHGHTPNKFCKDGYRQRTVAWMPFPEPYQTERREDE